MGSVCFFSVMVRCKAFLPSGIHDNAVIQSTSHLLPFTLPEETIMGCDGPLSTDEAHSHFLDGCVCVCVCVCLCVCVLYHQKSLFHKSYMRSLRRSDSHALERGCFSYPWHKFCLSLTHSHTLSACLLVSIIQHTCECLRVTSPLSLCCKPCAPQQHTPLQS